MLEDVQQDAILNPSAGAPQRLQEQDLSETEISGPRASD
jgi:hypothetical protein